ncbi:DUF1360 domain-containing protein [Amycolatopsis sp. FDAARGOS 1241]|uniref:DUF1360 domain-containing protein n=1 Tax=Amycolatopsis sp. FDAARGOS 1241 TaxID=2778070 RepID=UPI0019523D2B|nr:DUF1360 domain-containing protein [Amycolatopsis sp. FDAARGOS 1241]QRP49699.1 DUF1360 domain-containing protein [Amycolatopsis sp. FDAARGOS 1241]
MTRDGPGPALRRIRARYSAGEDRPLAGYLGALGAYAGTVGALGALGRVAGVKLPRRWSPGDLALLALATFKGSRTLAKATVTSPLRAPFTRFEGPAGEDELNESVPVSGPQHAVGELLSCPFCLDVWVGTGLTAGLVAAPRATRLALTLLTALAGADVAHLLYDSAKKLAEL